jgi:hypothetical protein
MYANREFRGVEIVSTYKWRPQHVTLTHTITPYRYIHTLGISGVHHFYKNQSKQLFSNRIQICTYLFTQCAYFKTDDIVNNQLLFARKRCKAFKSQKYFNFLARFN